MPRPSANLAHDAVSVNRWWSPKVRYTFESMNEAPSDPAEACSAIHASPPYTDPSPSDIAKHAPFVIGAFV